MNYLAIKFEGYSKLIMFLLGSCLMLHIIACMWALMSVLAVGNEYNHVWADDFPDHTPMELYLESLYWAVQTITTVGYGDNTISTHHE